MAVAVTVAAVAASALAPAPATSAVSECDTEIPGLGPATTAAIPSGSTQVVVTAGYARRSSDNIISFWERNGLCWSSVRQLSGRNGYAGWHERPWDGSGLSPIGVFTMSDAGGRLRNPGTSMKYFYRPKGYPRGFRMNSNKKQVFNYLIAINFNRYQGRSPLHLARPDPTIPDGGIWFHVNGAGPTRGCVSLPQSQMKWALRWMKPDRMPTMVMGPVSSLAK